MSASTENRPLSLLILDVVLQQKTLLLKFKFLKALSGWRSYHQETVCSFDQAMIRFWQRSKEDFSNLQCRFLTVWRVFKDLKRILLSLKLWQYVKVQHKFPTGGNRLLFFCIFVKNEYINNCSGLQNVAIIEVHNNRRSCFLLLQLHEATLTGI